MLGDRTEPPHGVVLKTLLEVAVPQLPELRQVGCLLPAGEDGRTAAAGRQGYGCITGIHAGDGPVDKMDKLI